MAQVRMAIFLAAAVALGANQALAQVHFSDGGAHIIDYEIDDSVHIDDGDDYAEMQTTVNIVEGGHIPKGDWLSYNYLRAYNQSMVDVIGGYVSQLYSYDSSTVDISGGTVGLLHLCDSSTAEVSGGTLAGLLVGDTSTVYLTGGTGGARITASGSSIINITGGSWGELVAGESTTVNISGGSMGIGVGRNRVSVRQGSTVNMSGGSVDQLEATMECSVVLTGYDFEAFDGLDLVEVGIVDGVVQYEIIGTGTLTGKWFGQSQSWAMDITQNHATATIMAIPEPTTLALLGLGLLAVRRKKLYSR